MQSDNVLQTAKKNGYSALSEYQAKQFLQSYGIPVTKEWLCHSVAEARSAACQLGFPVVLKACSPQLLHKTEVGGVVLHLHTERDVAEAYQRITQQLSQPLDGVLVQEMVPGLREMIVGLHRDPQFGPCVMLGVGGVMAELFGDTVFRMAPVDSIEALDMIAQLRTKALLDAFRGQLPAAKEELCAVLQALGTIGLAVSQVAEIDINPLVITPAGRFVAVDALVLLA